VRSLRHDCFEYSRTRAILPHSRDNDLPATFMTFALADAASKDCDEEFMVV
jgi:hypothetical protein